MPARHTTNTAIGAEDTPIPLVGLGTWELRGRTCARLVEQALRLGYRHLDTAEMYGNEREIGEGLRASGVRRERVFVTTKVWPSHFAARDLERSAKDSLARLRLSEVDLLLLHWPNPRIPLSETLGALCKVRRIGLARHIGVSNFTTALIEEAVKLAEEPLLCNQIEMHVFLDQSKVIAACRRHGLAVVAYSPIARGGLRSDRLLARIGSAHGKTAVQVGLRYLVQQGVAVIPRTARVERLAENLAIFDFELSDRETGEIAGLARRGGRIVDYAYSGSPEWD
ncbi:MAG TPA: aldo/keto reductase [Xanthobacteraceae bacterium]